MKIKLIITSLFLLFTNTTVILSQSIVDSSKVKILIYDKKTNSNSKYTATQLSKEELNYVHKLLEKAILDYNSDRMNYIKSYNAEHPHEKPIEIESFNINLKEYELQYLPILNAKKEKEVFIDGACDGNFGLVKDGGKCYFHLGINLTRRNYTKVDINGEG